jgi:LPS sulfotransferase NodH
MARNYTRFIILSDARTGSNLVQDALNSHARIVCFRELFNVDDTYIDYDVIGYDGYDESDIQLRASAPSAFLGSRIFCEHAASIAAVGFKFHYNHFWFHQDLLPALTEDKDLRVVHLRRLNMLRTLVSAKIAEQTGQWLQHDVGKRRRQTLVAKLTPASLAAAIAHPAESFGRVRRFMRPVNSAPVSERQAVPLTVDECNAHFYRVQHEIAHFGDLFKGHPTVEITYEDLVADSDNVVGRIETFLGVEPAPMSTTLRRQNPEPLRELITNYDELRAAFAGTEHEAFFDD